MDYYRGLIIVNPHGTYIANKSKSLIVKAKKFSSLIDKKLLLIEDKKALGYIKLSNLREINRKEFDNLRSKHLITDDERKKWWPGKKILYVYKISVIKIFKNPILVEYTNGPQVVVKPENVIIKKVE
jgi:hypothetical protein